MAPESLGPICPICDSEAVELVGEVWKCFECNEYFDEDEEPSFEAYGRHKTKPVRERNEDSSE